MDEEKQRRGLEAISSEHMRRDYGISKNRIFVI
jgi:hypothetical protein